MGGHDGLDVSLDRNRTFFWLTTGKKLTYTFWARNNPNNVKNQEHCLQIWRYSPEYQWNDESCSKKMGFICENAFIQCDAVNKFFIKYEHLEKANMDQMTTRLQSLEQVARDGKEEKQKLKNDVDRAVQKLIDQQELTAMNLWENLQKQDNKLNEQIAQSMNHINANFDEKFNVK